ncbi:non-ribosomal peptide synthetase [Streptomyces sp. AC627_RSS907]|uniref:thioesterase domain-containing protein n=1 Tax=Streptomyces sp. AC627_RSS907 TaxID=2823684 RepID=UPI0020B74F47|nr:non-ribosomal peptide synthetase [Streptomyces sp. AC627_RSS907]
MPPRPVTPRDIYELRLWQIWSDILHLDDIGVKDDFFALGGDHAEARAVLDTTTAQLGAQPPPMKTFLEAPTIERIGCHLRARSRKLAEQPVVPLQPHGSKRPFFFLPSGEGNVYYFHALARRMAPDQPFLALQTRGLHGAEPPFDRVEDMAADHIGSMRAVQPRGPYLLGGHCVGAMVALEMALQLQRRGERVALLAAVDGLAPAPFFRDEITEIVQDPFEALIFFGSGFTSWFNQALPLRRRTLLAVEPERRPAFVTGLARERGMFPPDEPDDRMSRVVDLGARICRARYRPKDVYTGAVSFYRACESALCETATGGWEEVSTRPPRVRELPGDHVTLVVEPHVDHLARELRAAIAQTQV